MVHIGIARWRERWIANRSSHNNNNTQPPLRVAGVWDARLERETILLRDGRRLTYFLDGPPDILEQERRHQELKCHSNETNVPIHRTMTSSSPASNSSTTTSTSTTTSNTTPPSGTSTTTGIPPPNHESTPPRQRRQDLPHIFVFHAMFLTGNVFLMEQPPTDYVLVCVNRPGYFGSDAPPQPERRKKPHTSRTSWRNRCCSFVSRLRRRRRRNESSLSGKDHADDDIILAKNEEEAMTDDVNHNSKKPNKNDSIGPSSSSDYYTYKDFAKDIEELANHLRIHDFYVAGHSSGGPCALACAYYLSTRRVLGVGLLSSDPEYAHPSAPNKRWMNAFGVGTCLPILLENVLCCLPLARHASPGIRNDYRLETSLYCFDTECIVQPVTIYVGEHDVVLPPDISRHMHERLSNATLHVVPKAGHLSLLRQDVMDDFFETIVSTTSITDTDTTATSIVADSTTKPTTSLLLDDNDVDDDDDENNDINNTAASSLLLATSPRPDDETSFRVSATTDSTTLSSMSIASATTTAAQQQQELQKRDSAVSTEHLIV